MNQSSTNLTRHIDWGLLLVLILTLFTAIPLVSNTGLPNGSDVLYHTYRVGEMHRSWQHGLLFPSWAEGLYFGYGSPLFHFYASLTYYIISILIGIFNIGALDALRTILMLSLLGCSSGMYLFVKGRTGRLGGIIAGLVYVYSPYLMFTEAYARGTYPELLAFAIFPFILWRVASLRDRPTPLNFISVVLLQVALINAHNLMALTLTALTLGWIIWESAIPLLNQRSGRANWRNTILTLFTIVLGMGASASFWLPVVLENTSVSLQNVIGVALLDYRNFFVPIGDLLTVTPRYDAGAINALKELTILGVAQWGLALLGGLSALWLYMRGHRSHHPKTYIGMLYFIIMGLFMLWLVTPSASTFWEFLSPLQLLQFPWRLLGPIAACLAIIAGMNVFWLERFSKPLQMGLTALVIATPIVTVIPLYYVPEWTNTSIDTSISAYHASEQSGLQMGTTFTDEYRPANTFSMPAPTQSLLDDYADGYPIDKLNYSVVPNVNTVEFISNSPQSLEWQINAQVGFTVEIYNFYWEGWQATLNGQPADITPSPNHGFITVVIPEGEHTLRVFLGSTPARDLGNLITIASLIITVGVALYTRRIKHHPRPYLTIAPLSQSQLIGVILGGILALLLVFVLFREGIAWLNSPAGEALPATVDESFALDDTLQVLGYDINGRTFSAGDRLIVTVYWYTTKVTDINFSSFLHVSTGGPPVAQIDKLHPGGRAISEWWSPDGYIIDTYDLYLPDNLGAGEYQLYIGLYTCELMPADDCGNGYRPIVTNTDGEVVGDTVPFGTIEVR